MLRVLLVEDSAILATMLRETFEALEGVEVVATVADEATALAVATSKPVDVIVLDLQLKRGTGFGVLQRLGSKRPEVIVFTSNDLPEFKSKAFALGVKHFLTKANDYERLPALIKDLERQHQ